MENLNLEIELDDLKALFVHTRCGYPKMNFSDWCKEIQQTYINNYFNKEVYNVKKYTYSQWVNAQIMAIAY